MTHALHHYHVRKRKQPYPHTDKWKRFIDQSIYLVGILGPILTVPQLTKIWVEKSAVGVSLITWLAYLIGAIFWLFYGIVHKAKPIIFTYVLFTLVNILVVIGVLIY